MQNFNDFVNNEKDKTQKGNKSDNVFGSLNDIANKFNGKSGNDLLKAIYSEAEKGKRAGTLSNQDIDNFYMALSPVLDDKKRKILSKVIEDIKKI